MGDAQAQVLLVPGLPDWAWGCSGLLSELLGQNLEVSPGNC